MDQAVIAWMMFVGAVTLAYGLFVFTSTELRQRRPWLWAIVLGSMVCSVSATLWISGAQPFTDLNTRFVMLRMRDGLRPALNTN